MTPVAGTSMALFVSGGGCTLRSFSQRYELWNRNKAESSAFQRFDDELRGFDITAAVTYVRRQMHRAAQLPAIAVVQHDDRTVHDMRQYSLRDNSRGRVFPVARQWNRPHDDRVSQALRRLHHEPIPCAERRPHERRVHARGMKYGRIGAGQRSSNRRPAHNDEVPVVPCVVPQGIPLRRFAPHYVWVRLYGTPNKKKRCVYVFASQHVKDGVRVWRIRTIVKG